MADRLLVTAEGGPFHVEYALFDAGEIALGRNALGRPFEQGYATTAGDARHRLAQLGATPQLADTCADVMQPTLVQAYARGSTVRKVATMLDTQLLFESGRYEGGAGVYHGTFLDLASLALDLGYPSIGALFHALYLAVVLAGAPADAALELDTHELTLSLKPGERTHRRVALEGLMELPSLLQDLANRGGGRGARGRELPREELLTLLDARATPGADTGAYRAALDTRELPTRGPLARADLWEIELLLDAGDRGAASERLERVERAAGRSPATAYLRARQDLLAGAEDPAVLAARVSALALSMTSFVELGLLAGEAWMVAGDVRRAHAHAHDVIATKGIDATLRERANAVLHGAVRGPAPPSQPRAVKAAPVAAPSAPTEEVSAPFFPDPRAEPGRPRPQQRLENLAAAPRRPSHSGLVRVPAPGSASGLLAAPVAPPPAPAPSPVAGPPPPEMPSSARLTGPNRVAAPAPPPAQAAPTPSGPPPPAPPAATAPPASAAPPPAAPPQAAPRPPIAPELGAAPRVAAPPPHASRPPTAPRLAAVAAPAPDAPPAPRAPSKPPAPSAAPAAPPPPDDALSSMPAARPGVAPSWNAVDDEPSLPPTPDEVRDAFADDDLDDDEATPAPPRRAPADSEPPSIPTFMGAAPSSPPVEPATRPASSPVAAPRPASGPPPAPPGHEAPAADDAGEDSPAFSPADNTLPPNLPNLPNLPERAAGDSTPEVVAEATTAESDPAGLDEDDEGPPFAVVPRDATESQPGDTFGPIPVPFPSSFPSELSDPVRGLADVDLPTPTLSGEFMRGASKPPSLESDPVAIFARAPLFPRSDPNAAEPAAELPLPASLSAAVLVDTHPSCVLEARVQNTLLARELGLVYRARGVELRADLSGIEHMQAYLFRRFAGGVVDTPEGAREAQLHGAFLSEILARRLGAEWIDLSAHEPGHWEMVVAPGTRVWPFGRVSRLIVKGHKERDLVSYFLELESKRNRATH